MNTHTHSREHTHTPHIHTSLTLPLPSPHLHPSLPFPLLSPLLASIENVRHSSCCVEVYLEEVYDYCRQQEGVVFMNGVELLDWYRGASTGA